MKAAAMTSLPRSATRAEAGFVLVAVLWILAALATLASIYSSYTVNTAAASRVADDRVQAEASIRAGVEMAVFRQLALPEKARPVRGGFDMRVGRTGVAVRFRSEASRIDLERRARRLAGRAVHRSRRRFVARGNFCGAHRRLAHEGRGGANANVAGADGKEDKAAKEDKLYTDQHMPYPPRHAPFDNALELSLLPGVSLAVVERVLPFVTVFSGRSGGRRVQRGPDGPIRSSGNDTSNPWRGAERAGQAILTMGARCWSCSVRRSRTRHNREIESVPGVNRGRLRQWQARSRGGRVSPQGPRRQGPGGKDQGDKDQGAKDQGAKDQGARTRAPATKATKNPMNCFIGGTISMVRCNPRKDRP